MQNTITKGAFTALLLVSAVASADTQYPASDFQPSVVYQDETYIKAATPKVAVAPVKTTSKAADNNKVDSKYPAADFQPTVVFTDTNYQPSKQTAPVAVKTANVVVAEAEIDSKYPAANFQPKVIFSDANYQPSKSSVAQKSTTVENVSSTEVENAVVEAPSAKKDDSSTYLFGLIALVAAGFFLFKGQGSCPARKEVEQAPAQTATPNKLTGVARYLNKKAGTGVARYLEKQSKTPTTGVARYVAKQVIAKAKKETTGVEKYVRERG